MSVAIYYVQVTLEQLQLIKEQPALVWGIESDARFANASMLNMDERWHAISWLVSEKKRAEQNEYSAAMRVAAEEDRTGKQTRKDGEEFKKKVIKEMQKMGNKPVDIKKLPTDSLLAGIEGRGKQAPGLPDIEIGYGLVHILVPGEVKATADAFALVKESAIKAQFNRNTLEKYQVGGISWKAEPDSVLERNLLPSYRAISQFYQNAAKQQHYVLVFYQ